MRLGRKSPCATPVFASPRLPKLPILTSMPVFLSLVRDVHLAVRSRIQLTFSRKGKPCSSCLASSANRSASMTNQDHHHGDRSQQGAHRHLGSVRHANRSRGSPQPDGGFFEVACRRTEPRNRRSGTMKRESRMGSSSTLDNGFASLWARRTTSPPRLGPRGGRSSDCPRRCQGRISVRDSLVAALLPCSTDQDARANRDGSAARKLRFHHDSLDEQPDEYLGLLHDVLCPHCVCSSLRPAPFCPYAGIIQRHQYACTRTSSPMSTASARLCQKTKRRIGPSCRRAARWRRPRRRCSGRRSSCP